MAFCKEYNAATQDKMGQIIPVEITVFEVTSCRYKIPVHRPRHTSKLNGNAAV